MLKRLLSLVLSIAMVLSALPLSALALEEVPAEIPAETQSAAQETTEPTSADPLPETEETSAPSESVEASLPEETEEPTAESSVPASTEESIPETSAPASTEEPEAAGEAVVSTPATAAVSGSCGTGLSWTLSDDGTLTISGDGAMNNFSTNSSAPWFSQRVSVRKIILEEGVTSIGNYAFHGCANAVSVTIPSTVTKLGYNAFHSCSNLTSANLPSGITKVPSNLFYGCTALQSVSIPDTVTEIEYGAFYNCTSLQEIHIPEGVKTIGGSAFYNCTSLTSVVIPEKVTEISYELFFNCTSLQEVTLPAGITAINRDAFESCSALSKIDIPASVTYIGSSVFYGCSSLTEAVLPDGITSISSSLFYNCQNLSKVNIPDGTISIGSSAFQNCTALTSISIPEGVTEIQYNAFCDCTALKEISIPAGVTSIGGSAFYRCAALESVTLEQGLTTIGSNAFYGCTALKEISIPAGVTSIGNSAFYCCTALKEISIPAGVTTMGYSAFQECTALESVTLGQGLTTIYSNTFHDCTALKEITIPEGVTLIEYSAFYDCTSLETAVLPSTLATMEESVFRNCTSLSEIALPDALTSLGSGAFSGCAALETVTLSNNLQALNSSVFYKCSALTSIHIPASVSSIAYEAFYACDKLTDISFGHISSDPLSIADNTFYVSNGSYYNGPKTETTIRIPYNRDIHSAISEYDWNSRGRAVTYVSSGYLPLERIILSSDIPAEIEAGLSLTCTVEMDPWYTTSELIWELIPGTGSAVITQDGTLVGTKPGIVTVRCSSSDNAAIHDETQIRILPASAYVSSITLRSDGYAEDEVEIGHQVQLIADIQPGNAANKTLYWEVENGTGAATITQTGLLTGTKTGTVTVYATAQDGTEVVGSQVIYVMQYVEDITPLINGKAGISQLGLGETVVLGAKVLPENASNPEISWTVTNGPGEARIDSNNRLTGVTAGTVILTATAKDSRHLSVSTELTVVGEKKAFAVSGGNIYYNTETGTIVGSDNTVTNANIPGIIDGVRITAIGADAFRSNSKNLLSVTIPSSVTEIGDHAFYYCQSLASLRINGSNLKRIGDHAFYDCSSLTSLTIPESVTEIGPYAFWSLDDLKNLTVSGELDLTDKLSYGNTLESITLTGSRIIADPHVKVYPDGSMQWFDRLPARDAKTILIRDSVKEIGNYAFIGRDEIVTVSMGSGVTSIGDYAFKNCNNITTFSMGSNVTSIGDSAFEGCEKMAQLVLPEGLVSLGSRALSGCYSLTELELPKTLKHIGRECFPRMYEKRSNAPQILDLSANPTRMVEQELQLSCKVPPVLLSATNNQCRIVWEMLYTEEDYLAGKPQPWDIAHLEYDTGLLHAVSSGTVTVIAFDEYTGASGCWTIEVSSGVVIRSEEDQNFVTSGDTLQLSAWMMPANEKVDVKWSLRPQDEAYAAISSSGKVSARTVADAHQIEVTATPYYGGDSATMSLWVVPKTTGLYIYEGSGNVTDTELPVDMNLLPTLQLSAVSQPEGAMDQVEWKTSSEAIASVDAGLVTFHTPGIVTITALTTDGSGKSASVKLNVSYLDTAKTLTAVLDIPDTTLESGESALLSVFGSDPENPLDPALLTFGVPSSQQAIATVDSTGRITAGEKAGTITVTAALTGDPLGRQVSVKLTVIPRMINKLVLRTDAPAPAEILMADSSGNATTDAAEAAVYTVLLKKSALNGQPYSFVINPEAFTSAGLSQLEEGSLKWATSNSKLATVSVLDDGTALVTVKANVDGACYISAVTTDGSKIEGRLYLNVQDLTPRLETTSPKLNTFLTEAAVIALVESYGNAITDCTIHEYDAQSKTYQSAPSAALIPVYEDGHLTLRAASPMTNGTKNLLLKVTCVDGLTYEFQLKAKVSNKAPSITAKQSEKINLFYTDSEAALQLSVKDAQILDAALTDTTSFDYEYLPESGELLIRFSEAHLESPASKPDTKAVLLVWLDGYSQPMEKAVTIQTTTKKPAIQTSVKSSIINTAAPGEKSAAVGFVVKGSTDLLPLKDDDVTVTASFAAHRISDDQVILTLLDDASGGTATLLLQLENWAQPIKLTHTVKTESRAPSLKLGSSTLKLNQIFSAQTASTTATLSQSNLDIAWIGFESTAAENTAARREADKLTLEYDSENKTVVASITDPEDAPKTGSYAFTGTAWLTDGTELKGIKLKVSVAATAPQVKLKTSTLKLNRILYNEEIACTDVSLSKGNGYQLVGFRELDNWNHDVVGLDFVDGQLTAQLLDPDSGNKTYSFPLTPVLLHEQTNQEAALLKPVTVKVQVYSKDSISVSLSSKGKLDAVNPDSQIEYTVKKITNAAGFVEDVTLTGPDAHLFDAALTDAGTIVLKMLEGETYSTKTTYKVQFSFLICGQDVLSKVLSFRVSQSSLKFQLAPSTCTLYQSQTAPLTATLSLTAPEGATLQDVVLNAKSNQSLVAALGAAEVTISEDGRSAQIHFDVNEPASLTYGKSYVLYLDAIAHSAAQEAKPTTVKLTVKVQK